jgi:hypothetical protein
MTFPERRASKPQLASFGESGCRCVRAVRLTPSSAERRRVPWLVAPGSWSAVAGGRASSGSVPRRRGPAPRDSPLNTTRRSVRRCIHHVGSAWPYTSPTRQRGRADPGARDLSGPNPRWRFGLVWRSAFRGVGFSEESRISRKSDNRMTGDRGVRPIFPAARSAATPVRAGGTGVRRRTSATRRSPRNGQPGEGLDATTPPPAIGPRDRTIPPRRAYLGVKMPGGAGWGLAAPGGRRQQWGHRPPGALRGGSTPRDQPP